MAERRTTYYNNPFNSPYSGSYSGYSAGGPNYSKYPGQGGGGIGQWAKENEGLLKTAGGILGGVFNFLTGRAGRKQDEKRLEEERRQFEERMGFSRQQYQDERERQRRVAQQVAPLFEYLMGLDVGRGSMPRPDSSSAQNLFTGR